MWIVAAAYAYDHSPSNRVTLLICATAVFWCARVLLCAAARFRFGRCTLRIESLPIHQGDTLDALLTVPKHCCALAAVVAELRGARTTEDDSPVGGTVVARRVSAPPARAATLELPVKLRIPPPALGLSSAGTKPLVYHIDIRGRAGGPDLRACFALRVMPGWRAAGPRNAAPVLSSSHTPERPSSVGWNPYRDPAG